MSPDTLDLLQILSDDTILSPKVDYSKDVEKEEERYAVRNMIENEQDSDFSADTDSDYIPDNKENSDTEKLTRKSKKNKVVAMVHKNNQDKQVCRINQGTNCDTINNNSFQNSITNIDVIEVAESDIENIEIEMHNIENNPEILCDITNINTNEAAEYNIVEEIET